MENITYVNHGIGNVFDDGEIELNKNLKKYPKLMRAILKHERGHTKDSNFNLKDFRHDLTIGGQLSQWQLLTFIVRHPFALTQMLPFYYSIRRKELIIDKNAFIFWILILFFIIIGYYLA